MSLPGSTSRGVPLFPDLRPLTANAAHGPTVGKKPVAHLRTPAEDEIQEQAEDEIQEPAEDEDLRVGTAAKAVPHQRSRASLPLS